MLTLLGDFEMLLPASHALRYEMTNPTRDGWAGFQQAQMTIAGFHLVRRLFLMNSLLITVKLHPQ